MAGPPKPASTTIHRTPGRSGSTLNGATYLGRADHIGSVEAGKDTDLMIVRGNLSSNINDIENVEWVVQGGRVYDSAALLDSIKGTYGLY